MARHYPLFFHSMDACGMEPSRRHSETSRRFSDASLASSHDDDEWTMPPPTTKGRDKDLCIQGSANWLAFTAAPAAVVTHRLCIPGVYRTWDPDDFVSTSDAVRKADVAKWSLRRLHLRALSRPRKPVRAKSTRVVVLDTIFDSATGRGPSKLPRSNSDGMLHCPGIHVSKAKPQTDP